MKDELIYLRHMLDAIKAIERFTEGDVKDEKTFSAVVRQLLIIGEASNRLPSEFRLQHSDIPWRKIIDMRNVLVHMYEGLSEQNVWAVVADHLPPLKQQIQSILDTLNGG